MAAMFLFKHKPKSSSTLQSVCSGVSISSSSRNSSNSSSNIGGKPQIFDTQGNFNQQTYAQATHARTMPMYNLIGLAAFSRNGESYLLNVSARVYSVSMVGVGVVPC